MVMASDVTHPATVSHPGLVRLVTRALVVNVAGKELAPSRSEPFAMPKESSNVGVIGAIG